MRHLHLAPLNGPILSRIGAEGGMSRTPMMSDRPGLVAKPPANFEVLAARSAPGKSQTGVYSASWQQEMSNRSRGDIVKRQNPVTLPDTATVHSACRMIRDQRIGAVLVTGARGRLVGLFTGRDAVSRVVAEARDPATTLLRSVMTVQPDRLPPQARASDALQMMQAGGYRHLPVTDGLLVVGIVSCGDFIGQEPIWLNEETGFWEFCAYG